VEFRERAVELARKGVKPVVQIAKDLGISESCLRNWMAHTDGDENGSVVKQNRCA
jgi:transposase